MMGPVTNHVAGVVKQCAGFQQHPRLRRQMMHRLQLVEKQHA
jgi:hypothetical protein